MERLEPGEVVAVIPALDEAAMIGRVVQEVRGGRVDRVIVVDGGSRDGTPEVAAAAGAQVVVERAKGYGRACIAGIAAAGDAEVVVFLDGDGSDDASAVDALTRPILGDRADVVFGARHVSRAEPGAIAPAARFGNALASTLIRLRYGARVTDLAPFKAVRGEVLRSMRFRQVTYGWTTELTVAAARRGLRILEVPVHYRRRGGGKSKVSGTVRGSVLAGIAILRAVGAPTVMDRLLIMAKSPTAGIAKTRLAAAIGEEAAARLAEAFLADTLRLCEGFPDAHVGFFAPRGQHGDLAARFRAPAEAQRSDGLFNGLEEALARSQAVGFRRTVIVDADSPTLPGRLLATAFDALTQTDVVLGPTDDGGYYLIGARGSLPPGVLNVGVPSSRVFRATLDALRRARLRVAVLDPWYDIDTAEDLERLRRELSRDAALAPSTAGALARLAVGALT
jgi:rSAM/selenodomain-associated transferase 1